MVGLFMLFDDFPEGTDAIAQGLVSARQNVIKERLSFGSLCCYDKFFSWVKVAYNYLPGGE
jgi:hypothetical protein